MIYPINCVRDNFKNTYKELTDAKKSAHNIGVRTAKIKKQEYSADKFVRASMLKQGMKQVTPGKLPVLGFVIGFCLPVPFTGTLLAIAGGIAGIGLYVYKKFHANSRRNNSKLHNA